MPVKGDDMLIERRVLLLTKTPDDITSYGTDDRGIKTLRHNDEIFYKLSGGRWANLAYIEDYGSGLVIHDGDDFISGRVGF